MLLWQFRMLRGFWIYPFTRAVPFEGRWGRRTIQTITGEGVNDKGCSIYKRWGNGEKFKIPGDGVITIINNSGDGGRKKEKKSSVFWGGG